MAKTPPPGDYGTGLGRLGCALLPLVAAVASLGIGAMIGNLR
jgi:hypothetical protein